MFEILKTALARALCVLAVICAVPANAQENRTVVYQHGSTGFVATYPGGAGVSPHASWAGLEQVYGIPWTDVVGMRGRSGVLYHGKQGSEHMFTGTLAAPVLINGSRTTVDEVILQVEADAGVEINSIQIWDGDRIIYRDWNFGRIGPFDWTDKRADNTFRPNMDPQMRSGGLAITVGVTFREAGVIRFLGMGAHFVH